MKIKQVTPIAANLNRRLIPLSKHKAPKLELMFYEQDEINLLNQELVRLEGEARDIIITLDINKHLTGYRKRGYSLALFNIDKSIEKIKEKIYNIKKTRYAIQMAEYKKELCKSEKP